MIRSFKGSWWVRYGIVASFIVVVVVIVLAAVIQYPQHVSEAFRLYSNARLLDIQALEGLVERAVRGDISFDQLYRGIAHRAVELGSLRAIMRMYQ